MSLKRLLATITILSLLIESAALAFVPKQAKADVTGAIVSGASTFTGCFVGGILTQHFQDQINKGISALDDGVKKAEGKLLNKVSGGVFSATGLGGAVPVQDQSVQNTLNSINDTNVKNNILTRCLAWSILDAVSNNTLNIIRTSGPGGGPTFVTNWRNFELGAQYRGENIFRAELSTAQLCNYFSNDFKQSYGVDPNKKMNIPPTQDSRIDSLQPFSLQTHCTLPSNFSLDNYQQNFAANGGWDTYDKMLEPQNNPYGVGFLSADEVQKQRSLEQTTDLNQVTANNGYLGISSCLKKDQNGNCLFYGNIKTPGSYLAQSVNQTITSQFNWLTSAQGLNTIIANATGVLLNHLLNLSDGSDNNNNNYYDAESYYQTPNDDDTSFPDGSTPTGFPSGPTPNEQSVVQSALDQTKKPLTEDGIVKMLKSIAQTLNANGVAGGPFGVLVKTSGTNCSGYSCDIICTGQGNAQMQWDVLSGADVGTSSAKAQWDGPMMLPNIAVRECEIQGGSPSTSTSTNSPSGSSNNSSTSGTSTSSGGTSSSGNNSSPSQF